MSKKIQIDIEVNGKMTKATVDAKALRGQLDGVDDAQKKTTKSGEKFQKGLKGVGEQSANASKNFSKFSAGMGGFVGVYASLAAQLFAISAGFQFLKRAGDLQALKTGQESYAAATGIAMRALTKDIQNATNAQITFQDAAQAGAIGVAAGLSADQLTRLGSAAADASQILGRDVTDSFNRLIRGVTKAEPELLDELGIILRLKDATQIYADSIGKNVNQLTQFEKSQAVANDVLTQAEEKYSRILEITGRAPNQFSQLGIAFDNVTNSIKVVSTLAGPMATVLTKTPALAAAAFGLLLSGPLAAMGFSLKDIADNAEESAKRQIKAIEKVETQQLKNKNVLKDRQKELMKLAETEVTAGSSSKILKNLAKGGKLYGVDKANLRKALKAAEAQLREHGSITTGIFAGRDRAVLASFTTTLDQMDTAIEGTVSTWQKANLRMQGMWATTTAFIQSGIAKITRGFNFLLRAAGFIGIAVFALQTLKEMFKDPLVQTDDEKTLAEQARAAEMARDRLKGLVDEYKNFRVVQQVNFEFAKGNVDVLLNSAASLGNMLGTTFDARNIKVFTGELINLRTEQHKVNESTRLYNQFVDTTAENIPFVSIAAKIADAAVGTDNFTGAVKLAVKGMANLAVVTGNFLNTIGFLDDDEIPTYQLSEGAVGAKANLERSIGALKDFQKQTDKMGVSGYKVFTEFDQLLDIGQRIADGSKVSADEVKRFQENMGETAAEAQRLAGNIKSLEEGAKAVAQAMAQVEGKMKGSTQGDLLRDAAVAQIKLMSDIAAERDDPSFTDAEKKRLALLNDQAMLGEEIAKHESKYKTLTISQQTASIRNYATMSQTRGKLLQQSDKIGAAELAGNKAQEERNRLFTYYTSEGRRITPEIQRQLDLLDATVEREQAKEKLAEEQLLTLVQQNTILERQETLRDNTKIENAQKVINQALEKEVSLRRQILDTKMKIAKESINEAAADAEVANPFFDKERFVAEETLRLETETYALRAAQIEQEYQTKLQSIDLEYTLLDAKRVQTMLEMQKLALDLQAQDKGAQAQKAAEMAARLAGVSYKGAKSAAIDMAAATREASLFNLNKGVRSAQRVVKALQPIRQVMKTAADSFETALNDSVNAIFDSLSDKTMDLSEKLKDIADNLLQAIQKAVTQKLLVDPLLNALGLGTANQAQKIARAHATGADTAAATLGTTFSTGATQMGTAISTALSTQLKVCCCDNSAVDGVAIAEMLGRIATRTPTGEPGKLPDGTVTGTVFGDVSSDPINQGNHPGATATNAATKVF